MLDEFPAAPEPLAGGNRARPAARCSLIKLLLIPNEVSLLTKLLGRRWRGLYKSNPPNAPDN